MGSSPAGTSGKEPPANAGNIKTWEMQVWNLGWEDPLETGKATHSSILPEESHAQTSLGDYVPQGCRVRHDWNDLAWNINI